MAIKTGSENSAITRPTTVAVRFFREIELSIVGPERLKYTGGPVRSPRELVHDTALAVRLVVVNRSRTMPAIGHPQPVVPQRCQCEIGFFPASGQRRLCGTDLNR